MDISSTRKEIPSSHRLILQEHKVLTLITKVIRVIRVIEVRARNRKSKMNRLHFESCPIGKQVNVMVNVNIKSN